MKKWILLAFLALSSVCHADTKTNRLGLTLMTPGTSINTWGSTLNKNFQLIDAGISTTTLVISTTIACVTVIHMDGSQSIYQPAVNTNVGRGDALILAASNLKDNDTLLLSGGTFTVSNSAPYRLDLSNNNTVKNITLRGTGIDQTVIFGNAGNLALVHVGYNSEIDDLSVIADVGGYILPIGTDYSGDNLDYGFVKIKNVATIGQTDGIYLFVGRVQFEARNYRCNGNYDCVNFAPGGAGYPFTASMSSFAIYDSTLTSRYNGSSNILRGMVCQGGNMRSFNTRIYAGGGGTTNDGIYLADPGGGVHGLVYVEGGEIATSGTPSYDLDNQDSGSGFIYVTANTVYDTTKLNGTITPLDTNQIVKSIINLGGASNTTFLRGDGTFAVPTLGAGNAVLVATQTFSGINTFSTVRIGGVGNPGVMLSVVGGGAFTSSMTVQGQLLGKGTATNDDAAAGYIGEYVSSVISNQSVGTNGLYFDITSISLTAGDWDVSAQITYVFNGATVTDWEFGIGLVAGNDSTGFISGDTYGEIPVPVSSSRSPSGSISSVRKSLNTTTAIYLKGFCTYTVATPKVSARISARRVR